jgi:CheY-like chemotaxis protein
MGTETKPFEILLAEDNSADVVLVRQALKIHNVDCTLHLVRDGEEAINWIIGLDANPEAPRLDLVLLDLYLPKRDGQDILKYLRATKNHAQTPVIIMTSLDSSVIDEKAGGYEAVVYFQKSSTLDEFMQLGLVVQCLLAGQVPGNSETALDQENVGGAA